MADKLSAEARLRGDVKRLKGRIPGLRRRVRSVQSEHRRAKQRVETLAKRVRRVADDLERAQLGLARAREELSAVLAGEPVSMTAERCPVCHVWKEYDPNTWGNYYTKKAAVLYVCATCKGQGE